MIESAYRWIQRNLKIIDNRVHSGTFGQLIKLFPNVGQLKLDLVMERQRGDGYPVRILLLKPRQVGWSTWCEARGFEYINHTSQRTALVVSADIDSTNFVFNMTRLFQAELPDGLRLPTDASSRKELVYSAPHRSRFITQTAGKDILGRGGTVHYFHGSEVAMWPDAKAGLAAVLQMIPYRPETTIILESTANGQEGAFYELFWQAVDRQRREVSWSGYLPVFFPWYEFEEYQQEVPAGFKLDELEEELRVEFGLSNEQFYWRRLKLAELGGDETLFKQEYPATALEAFQGSGNPVFTQKMIEVQSNKISKEVRYSIFTRDKIEDVGRKFNCWQIRHMPHPDREYVMGVDTMEARLSDINDPQSNLDYHGAAIMDRLNGEYCAIFHGQCNIKDLAEQVLYAGYLYNNCLIAPEVPHGMMVLDYLRENGYENIYSRQIHDEQIVVEDSDNLGWRTTLITRQWLIDSFLAALRDNSITIGFSDLLDEMRTFIRDKTGRAVHASGRHDDILFAAMIALQIHLRTTMQAKPYQYDYVGEVSREEMIESMEKPKTLNDLAKAGVIDSGIEEEEEDEE